MVALELSGLREGIDSLCDELAYRLAIVLARTAGCIGSVQMRSRFMFQELFPIGFVNLVKVAFHSNLIYLTPAFKPYMAPNCNPEELMCIKAATANPLFVIIFAGFN
jgi:hypothetical protein